MPLAPASADPQFKVGAGSVSTRGAQMAEKMSCLVTGGAGFIGSHLAGRLVALGHDVRVVDNLSTGHERNLRHLADGIEFCRGDLCDEATCREVTRGIELVFHVAALPSVPRSLADPWASHDNNVNATLRLLQACQAAGVRRVIYSSSSSVYGDTPALPKVESMEPLPRSPYAVSKLAGEQYVLAFARAGIVEGVGLRYFNVFGPRQDPNSAYAAVIPAFLSAVLHRRPAKLFGDGSQTRDFTYVDNVLQANLLAATGDAERVSGHVVNVGAGQRTSLRQVLDLVRDVTGAECRVEQQPPRAGDVRDSLAGLQRIEAVLGYRPAVSLSEGLQRTWTWLSEQDDRRSDVARTGAATFA